MNCRRNDFDVCESTKVMSAKRPRCMRIDLYANRLVCETTGFPHHYSSSHANQRVENWWSHSKRGFTAWVIDFFKALVHEGKLALGNHLYLECVWFVFSEFLELELAKVKPCTNSSFNVSLKPMTGTVGDPVINCMILETSISGTPEKKIVLYFTCREYMEIV